VQIKFIEHKDHVTVDIPDELIIRFLKSLEDGNEIAANSNKLMAESNRLLEESNRLDVDFNDLTRGNHGY